MEYNEFDEFTQFTIRANTSEHGLIELVCTPENTALYLHHPSRNGAREYDHFFTQIPEELVPEEMAGRNVGSFVTRHVLGEEEFERMANLVSASCNFPVVYRPEPTASDRKNIDEQMESLFAQQLDEIDPEDFM